MPVRAYCYLRASQRASWAVAATEAAVAAVERTPTASLRCTAATRTTEHQRRRQFRSPSNNKRPNWVQIPPAPSVSGSLSGPLRPFFACVAQPLLAVLLLVVRSQPYPKHGRTSAAPTLFNYRSTQFQAMP